MGRGGIGKRGMVGGRVIGRTCTPIVHIRLYIIITGVAFQSSVYSHNLHKHYPLKHTSGSHTDTEAGHTSACIDHITLYVIIPGAHTCTHIIRN